MAFSALDSQAAAHLCTCMRSCYSYHENKITTLRKNMVMLSMRSAFLQTCQATGLPDPGLAPVCAP